MANHPTHLSTTVVETHQGEDGGTVVTRVAQRTEEETDRLHRLVRRLDPQRTFSVVRGIVCPHPLDAGSKRKPTRPTHVEERSLTVRAGTAAEAAQLANEHKARIDVEVRA